MSDQNAGTAYAAGVGYKKGTKEAKPGLDNIGIYWLRSREERN
jgi:hypothetical protein